MAKEDETAMMLALQGEKADRQLAEVKKENGALKRMLPGLPAIVGVPAAGLASVAIGAAQGMAHGGDEKKKEATRFYAPTIAAVGGTIGVVATGNSPKARGAFMAITTAGVCAIGKDLGEIEGVKAALAAQQARNQAPASGVQGVRRIG